MMRNDVGIQDVVVSMTPAGAAGSAQVTQATPDTIQGYLIGIYVAFTTQPATTDLTITLTSPSMGTVLTLTNVNTSGWYPIRIQNKDTTGTAISASYDLMPLNNKLECAVAQGDPVANGVVVTFRIFKA